MIYLRSLDRKDALPKGDAYPLSTSVLQGLQSLAFDSSVTLLCGDNGSGKTTLLELLAAGIGATPIGENGTHARKMSAFRAAAKGYRYAFNKRPRSSFYFTAEDFSRYLDDRQRMLREARDELDALEEAYKGRSAYARKLASQPHARALNEMSGQYGRELLQASHGEGFLSFFAGRLHRGGLYLLDEPEGALSYENQLALLALIDQAVAAEGQVIMATHSPVLAAYPGAQVLELREGAIEPIAYERLSSVQFLKHFLLHHQGILARTGIVGVPGPGSGDGEE
jgi:predicted ATPase